MKANEPLVSIVIPARNAASELELCLKAIRSLNRDDVEVIVVDDASTDKTPEIADRFNCKILKQERQQGPGAARNRGSREASANIILFIDSDIIINKVTIPLIIKTLSPEGVTAVVGMLDTDMPYRNISSQYFNLRKHYDYLLINDDLKNLYTSVTAIKKDIFLKAGGFNESYTGASVEDAELGRRLVRLGHRIKLNKDIKVTHMKKHTLTSLIKSDFMRAASFIKFLIRERLSGNIMKEKRFVSFRIGALGTVSIVPLMILSLILLPFFSLGHTAFYLCLFLFFTANFGFLRFTAGIVGWRMNILMPFMIMLDSLAIFAGILFGVSTFIMGNRY